MLLSTFCRLGLIWAFVAAAPAQAFVPGVIVDKKTNALHLVNYEGRSYRIIKTFHTTLGLVAGDKEIEGDKKTPEGIYFFEEVRRPPNLEAKFGNLALTMNYPNAWDRYKKRTGSGIWFHATNEPSRLSRDLDSLGCVVVKDEELAEIFPQLRYRVSPITIYEDFARDKAVLNPDRLGAIEEMVQGWANAWSAKDLGKYIGYYHPDFSSDGESLAAWRAHKGSLNHRYAKIKVTVSKVQAFAHPKYDVAIFHQIYEAKNANGSLAKRSTGVKILYIAKLKGGEPRILAEQYRNADL
jgi:murein L,D-transpeptidase YafK